MSFTVSEVCITKTVLTSVSSLHVWTSHVHLAFTDQGVSTLFHSAEISRRHICCLFFCLYRMYPVNEEFHICDILTLIA